MVFLHPIGSKPKISASRGTKEQRFGSADTIAGGGRGRTLVYFIDENKVNVSKDRSFQFFRLDVGRGLRFGGIQ